MAKPQSAAEAWSNLIRNSFRRRVQAKQLEFEIIDFEKRWRANSPGIAKFLLGHRRTNGTSSDDPLLFQYTEILLAKGFVKSGDLLYALLQTSSFGRRNSTRRETDPELGWPSCEERIFSILFRRHLNALPSSSKETLSLVFSLTEWLATVSDNETARQVENGGLNTVDAFTFQTYDVLGQLTIAVFRNPSLLKFTKTKWWVANRASIVRGIRNFSTNVLGWMQSQHAGHLDALTDQAAFIEVDKDGRPIFTDDQILNSVPEIAVVPSRAGLFVWLNAALAARPMTDSMATLSYLQSRFPGDAQSSIISLLAASFDVLINAMLQKESRQSVKIIRSFICNKLPMLLSMLSGSLSPPMTIEACIQLPFMAGGMISMDPLPPLTPGASDVNESLKATRLEFLQACATHGLVSESTIASVLGGPIALPRTTKLVKETLVAQCAGNLGRLEGLIDDLVGYQGNSGAISQCVVTTINNLCLSKDTMSLKTVCNELIKSSMSSSLDIIMQYTHPATLLIPLCTVLNEWVHDQDQIEFTPAYEEFASILLFTLSVIYRYALEPFEYGVASDSFIGKLMGGLSSSKPLTELSDEQNSQLKKWIDSLFAVDEHGETIGIRDDVMRHCSPHSFYLLVPILFEQSVLACRTNALPMRTLQGGLELLLEPFLLPCLIMGLSWLSKHSWEDHNDANVLLQVLDKLLKPSSSSQETLSMHHAIITIVALPLSESLQILVRKQPQNKKAAELGSLLQKNFTRNVKVDLQRTLHSSKTQLDALMQIQGKIERHVSQSIKGLIDWAMSTSEPSTPPAFSYRHIAIASQILDGDVLLDCLLREVREVPEAQMPLALDICTAIACAPPAMPTATLQAGQMMEATAKLRNTIQVRAADVQALLDRPQAEVEALIRLSRRIANQLAIAQLPPIAMPLEMQDQGTDQIMQDLGLDIAADVSGATGSATLEEAPPGDLSALGITAPSDQQMVELSAVGDTAMDIDNAELFGDIGLSMDQPQQNGMTNPEEDIFAGLTGLDDMDDFGEGFSFD